MAPPWQNQEGHSAMDFPASDAPNDDFGSAWHLWQQNRETFSLSRARTHMSKVSGSGARSAMRPQNHGSEARNADSHGRTDSSWAIVLRAEGEGPPAQVRIRQGLKRLLRAHGLRCTALRWPGPIRAHSTLPRLTAGVYAGSADPGHGQGRENAAEGRTGPFRPEKRPPGANRKCRVPRLPFLL